jgi:hypothetical protein
MERFHGLRHLRSVHNNFALLLRRLDIHWLGKGVSGREHPGRGDYRQNKHQTVGYSFHRSSFGLSQAKLSTQLTEVKAEDRCDPAYFTRNSHRCGSQPINP